MKYKIGDRVELRLSGNVVGMSPDGKFLQLDNDVHLNTKTPTLQLRKVARRKPPVGSIISAADLRETWWKRGTVIQLEDSDEDGTYSWRYMLLADGTWMEDSGEKVRFGDFIGGPNLRVVHLP